MKKAAGIMHVALPIGFFTFAFFPLPVPSAQGRLFAF